MGCGTRTYKTWNPVDPVRTRTYKTWDPVDPVKTRAYKMWDPVRTRTYKTCTVLLIPIIATNIALGGATALWAHAQFLNMYDQVCNLSMECYHKTDKNTLLQNCVSGGNELRCPLYSGRRNLLSSLN